MKEIIPIVGSLSFLVCIVCFVLVYKNKKKKKNYKKHLIIGIVSFIISGVLVNISKQWDVKSIMIENISVYKNEAIEIDMVLDPIDANNSNIKCIIKDDTLASIDKKTIKGLEVGTTTYSCSTKDITSNDAVLNVILTEEQTKTLEEERIQKEAEEAAKAAQELAEKQAEIEANKNTLSSYETAMLKGYAEDIIDSVLKSPSSAEYPGTFLEPYNGWAMSKTNNLATIQSYVDSQNSFGAMIRSSFTIQVQINEEGNGQATYVEFEGQVLLGSYQ